jgi:hypothetical protein
VLDRRLLRRLAVLVVVALVTACGGRSSTPSPQPPSLAIRDRLDPRSPCVLDPDPSNGGHPAPPAEVTAAGDPTDPAGVVAVTAVGLGDIVLPSDRLLTGDLFAMNAYFLPGMVGVDLEGFTGRAPVCLHIARLAPPEERAAFLHVRLAHDPVVRWEVGTAGFGVDGGTGGIASAEAVRAATGDITEFYLHTLEAQSVGAWGWVDITTDAVSGANVIGFSTGYGDGGYPVYAGFTSDGRVAAVVIDMFVLPWSWLARVGPTQ